MRFFMALLALCAGAAIVFFALAEDYDYCEKHGGVLVGTFVWYRCVKPMEGKP